MWYLVIVSIVYNRVSPLFGPNTIQLFSAFFFQKLFRGLYIPKVCEMRQKIKAQNDSLPIHALEYSHFAEIFSS